MPRLFQVLSTAALIAGAACTSAVAGLAPTMFGVASFGPFSTQMLYAIDPATGASTAIGSTGLTQINDIAYDAINNRMYALTTGADLYTINLSTGQASPVAFRAATLPEGGLAFSAATGLISASSASLLAVNSLTAETTVIGSLGSDTLDLSGLTFTASGALLGYAKNGANADTLVSIDPATGLATTLATLNTASTSGVGGLAFNPFNGRSYLTDSANLYTVDAISGTSLVGSLGAAGFSGIAFIPSPAAAAVAGMGLLAASRRRR